MVCHIHWSYLCSIDYLVGWLVGFNASWQTRLKYHSVVWMVILLCHWVFHFYSHVRSCYGVTLRPWKWFRYKVTELYLLLWVNEMEQHIHNNAIVLAHWYFTQHTVTTMCHV